MKLINLLFLCLVGQFAFGQYYYLDNAGAIPNNLNMDNTFPAGSGQPAGWTSILGPSVSTPTWSTNQTIPFAFNFNGSPVTDFKVSSTGVLTFDVAATAVPGTTPMALPNASIPDNSVCLWGLIASGSNDNVSTKTFGSAPNRQHWVHFSSCVNGTISWSYYSIVFVEGSDNIYLVDQRNTTGTGSLSAGIQINSSTAYSVAGSPTLGAISGTDASTGDDYYYEFLYGIQPADEVQLTDFNLLPYVASGNNAISGTVKNLGTNTITSLDVTWNDGSGANVSTISSLNIMPNADYTFTHPTQLNAIVGTSYTIDLSATIAGDADLTNNTIQKSTATLTTIPTKFVVGEEKTGTWCGWCPRGAVGMAGMESNPNFIGIAVHNGDPMTVASYDGNIGTYIPGGYPRGGVDRVADGNPANFSSMYNARSSAVVPCAVQNINAIYNTTTNEIELDTEVEFFGTISGNYRISAVVVENDVIGGSASNWKQVNYYNSGSAGALVDPVTGFNWVGAGNPVNSVDFGGYDHVARYLSDNDILGDAGSLPTGSVPLGVHNYTFTNISGNVVDQISKAHVVVMVINADNGEILNAGETVVEFQVELELTDFDLPAVLPFGSSDIIGTVKNNGITSITNIDVTWDSGTGANTANISGLNIMPGTSYTFTHPTQISVTTGTAYSISLMATTTNDAISGNNTIIKTASVPSDVGIENLSQSFEFNIYPNPTKGNMTLMFSFNETSKVNYFITDAVGNIVIDANQQSLNSGEQKIQIDGSNLSNGIYFVHVQVGDKLTTKKINIIK